MRTCPGKEYGKKTHAPRKRGTENDAGRKIYVGTRGWLKNRSAEKVRCVLDGIALQKESSKVAERE
jgi:hypothetical protein